MKRNKIIVTFVLSLISKLIFAQDLSIQETIDYINNLLSCGNTSCFKITVDDRGWMKDENNHGVFISDLKSEEILVQDQYHWVRIPCKSGNCYTNNLNRADSYAFFSMCWYLNSDEKEKLGRAFSYLISKYNELHSKQSSNDPFASNSKKVDDGFGNTNSSETVQMIKMQGGIYEVPVTINDVLKISFIFDSGASDVSISPDVALTLIKTGTVKESDFIGSQTYSFADGSKATSRRFIIKKLTIGSHVVTNVIASISNSINAPMLLGQSVQQKFGKITIDNTNHVLKFEK